MQITLSEYLVGMTIAGLLSWLVLRPTDLVVILVPPVLIYFAGEAWWARRRESTLGASVKIALLSTLGSAPLTGISVALHGPHEGIASTGVVAFLGATLFAAVYGLKSAFTALVVFFACRDLFRICRRLWHEKGK